MDEKKFNELYLNQVENNQKEQYFSEVLNTIKNKPFLIAKYIYNFETQNIVCSNQPLRKIFEKNTVLQKMKENFLIETFKQDPLVIEKFINHIDQVVKNNQHVNTEHYLLISRYLAEHKTEDFYEIYKKYSQHKILEPLLATRDKIKNLGYFLYKKMIEPQSITEQDFELVLDACSLNQDDFIKALYKNEKITLDNLQKNTNSQNFIELLMNNYIEDLSKKNNQMSQFLFDYMVEKNLYLLKNHFNILSFDQIEELTNENFIFPHLPKSFIFREKSDSLCQTLDDKINYYLTKMIPHHLNTYIDNTEDLNKIAIYLYFDKEKKIYHDMEKQIIREEYYDISDTIITRTLKLNQIQHKILSNSLQQLQNNDDYYLLYELINQPIKKIIGNTIEKEIEFLEAIEFKDDWDRANILSWVDFNSLNKIQKSIYISLIPAHCFESLTEKILKNSFCDLEIIQNIKENADYLKFKEKLNENDYQIIVSKTEDLFISNQISFSNTHRKRSKV